MPNSGTDSIAANAHRLFEDAKLLLERGRYPAAVVSAILAIEEVGKYHIYRWKIADPAWQPKRQFPPRHADKQAAFASIFVIIVQMQALCEICAKFGVPEWNSASGTNDWEKTQDFLLEGYLVSQHGDTSDERKRAVDILNTVAEYVQTRSYKHPLACLMQLADSGEIDKAKQAALYVDLTRDGTVTNDPGKMDVNAAEFWIDVAQVALESLRSLEEAEAAGGAFARKYRVLPPPRDPESPATAEDWCRLLERLEK